VNSEQKMIRQGFPERQGLYDPQHERDSCGVGFVCNMDGRKTHEMVKQANGVLKRLAHRGAVGADPKTGDGAGILIQIPHEFFLKVASEHRIDLPPCGQYGTGLVFLPTDANERKYCKQAFEKIIREEGQTFLGWRKVPVDDSDIGHGAKETQPVIEQVFVGQSKLPDDALAFERKLYVIRRQIENWVGNSKLKQKSFLGLLDF